MPNYDAGTSDLSNWSPYKAHVQGGLREGNYLNGQFILICAGPPFFSDMGGAATSTVYPIGLTQNVALSQNKAISRIFEIGSDRSYFIAGRSVGQLSLGRVVYHGPSLLRCLYASYSSPGGDGSYAIDPLVSGVNTAATIMDGATPAKSSGVRHGIRIPPGYDNMFLNLASDLFSQPIGLYLVFKDNEKRTVGSIYLDQCYVPTHSIAVDAQGLIVQESVGIQYERMVPVKTTDISLLDNVLSDQTSQFGAPRPQ
jgi:hypothetical protein